MKRTVAGRKKSKSSALDLKITPSTKKSFDKFETSWKNTFERRYLVLFLRLFLRSVAFSLSDGTIFFRLESCLEMVHVDALTFCQQRTFLDAKLPRVGSEFSDTAYFLEPYWLTGDFSIRKNQIPLDLYSVTKFTHLWVSEWTRLLHGYPVPAGLNWPIGIK